MATTGEPLKAIATDRWVRVSRGLGALALTLLVSGCASFEPDWKQAGRTPAPPDAITGRWEGFWLSDVNAHTGKLRCLITHQTNDLYAARFRATYLKVLRFSYTVPLRVESRDGGWSFRGEEDLGVAAGGIYRYVGTASATNFHSTYDSKYDRGTFEMRRP